MSSLIVNPYRFAIQGISFIGGASGASIGESDFDITLPGGMAENDFVLVGTTADNGPSITPTGYTSIDLHGDNFPSVSLSYKFMGSTPDTAVTIAHFGLSGVEVASCVLVFRGVNTVTPQDTTRTKASGGSGDPNPPSITTVTDGACVVACGHLDDDVITIPSISGYSDLEWQTSGNGAEAAANTMLAWKLIETAGAEDPPSYVTSGSDDWVAYSVALRPA
jgi:hypothetical protein